MDTTKVAERPPAFPGLDIGVIVPCHNEAPAIAKVVTDLREALPGATVYVYDNRSTDDTAERARQAGAVVRREHLKGKGNVVRRAFADIEADVYLLIDGDDTYDALAAPQLVQLLLAGPHDHVLGVREPSADARNPYRAGHERGNKAITALAGRLGGGTVDDMLSGYRAMSRRFVKSFPAVSREFEIETELTVHTLALRLPNTSLNVGFRDRAEGSESKLRTYRDGFKIISLMLNLARHERPVSIYGSLAALAVLIGSLMIVPVAREYARTGLVPRVPTLLLGLVMGLLGLMLAAAGLILDGIRKSRQEAARLAYLQYPPVHRPRPPAPAPPHEIVLPERRRPAGATAISSSRVGPS